MYVCVCIEISRQKKAFHSQAYSRTVIFVECAPLFIVADIGWLRNASLLAVLLLLTRYQLTAVSCLLRAPTTAVNYRSTVVVVVAVRQKQRSKAAAPAAAAPAASAAVSSFIRNHEYGCFLYYGRYTSTLQ